jgi:hypothetical protein
VSYSIMFLWLSSFQLQARVKRLGSVLPAYRHHHSIRGAG